MKVKKTLFTLFLSMMLLAGCGGGPSPAEGAEPPAALPVTGVQIPESNSQETQEPQESEIAQEPESAPAPEINSWKSLMLVNADTIIAETADGTYAILDSNGVMQKTLPECKNVALVNQNCFRGRVDSTFNLYDLNGSVVLTSQTDFDRTRLNTGEDPWGVIRYEVVEKSDFGGKAVTHFMRTDTFEDIYQADGTKDSFAGAFGYDGTQYLLKTWNADTRSYIYTTLDGTELPDYQEIDPYAVRWEYDMFLLDLAYYRRDIAGNGVGALAGKRDGTTDIYSTNRELCASYDSEVRFGNPEPVGNLGILTTNTAAGFQTGIFDFQTGEFLLIVDGEVRDTVIRDAYTLETSAFLLENAGEMHTLVCRNGTMVENVSGPSSLRNSATGYILLTSTTDADKIVIINVDTGEIVSEFQAHLIQ